MFILIFGLELVALLTRFIKHFRMQQQYMYSTITHQLGKGVVDRILAQVNKNDLAAKIIIESQPANSPDTNVCDLGLFRSMKTEVRKHRSLETHRNYTMKQLINNDDDNDEDDNEDDDNDNDEKSESELPELKCGIKKLLSGKDERCAKCVECDQRFEEGVQAIKCSVRGGWSCRLIRRQSIRFSIER